MFNNPIFTNLEIERSLVPGNSTYPEFATTPTTKYISVEIASIDRYSSKSTGSHIGIMDKNWKLICGGVVNDN